jgi:large subunit ribosomal protein L18
MAKTSKKVLARTRRKYHIRKRIVGTEERPRVSVFRSAKHIYAQIIVDESIKGSYTIGAAGSNSKALNVSNGGNIEAAEKVGQRLAEIAKENNINKVIFDRNGYLYHGRVKALAEAIRQSGLLN